MADVSGLTLGAPHTGFPVGTPAFSNFALDASNDGAAWAFQALNDHPITGCQVRIGARAGTPPTYVVTLEQLSATTGFPDGTDIGGASPTAKTFTPPADATWDGTLQTITFTNAYTPARGQRLCLTLRHSSGTVDGSNHDTFTTDCQNLIAGSSFADWNSLRLTAGTWGKVQRMPNFGIVTASERYGFPLESFYNTRSGSTVGHRQALKFKLPAGSCSSLAVRGLRLSGSIAAAVGKNPVLGLWSAGGVLQNYTLDSDVVSQAANSYMFRSFLFDEVTLSALSPDTWYYAGLEVADAVNGGVLLNGLQLDSASDLSAFPGGSNWHLATYDGSNWTDDQTVRPFAELDLADLTGGSGMVLLGNEFSGGL